MDIADSDAFLDMPLSTQSLYFHLGMRADDEGFVSNPKRIMRLIGANEDDLKILIAKKFVLKFDSGICLIKHWRMNNYLQKDRCKPTVYTGERKLVSIKENGSYKFMDTKCIQNGYNLETQYSIGEVSIEEISIDNINTSKKTKQIKNKPKSFKTYTEQEFIKEVETFTDYSEHHEAFINYWIEPSPSGKMKFQLNKTWLTKSRLATWSRNNFNNNKPKFSKTMPVNGGWSK